MVNTWRPIMNQSPTWANAYPVSVGVNLTQKNFRMGQPLKPLEVEITEAVSKRLEIKYVIKGKSLLPAYENGEFQVERSQDEFEWLFTSLTDNPNYVGYLIPPKPPKTELCLKINFKITRLRYASKRHFATRAGHFSPRTFVISPKKNGTLPTTA